MAETAKDPQFGGFQSGNPVFDAAVTIICSRPNLPWDKISNIHEALLALTKSEPGGFRRLHGSAGGVITVPDPGKAKKKSAE